ncbi:MAG TPA: VOC family protein [Anaeromyxobacteraceae bacterium]|nr:VOC family protein [Anaeromyxobacteraceae bacterium]
MHRSRLAAFVIDCQVDDVDAAARFWSAALGRPVDASHKLHDTYREIAAREEEPVLLVQKVDHPSRIHLDIEADDLEAEVRRLEGLGARRVGFVKRWWVMEAPTGQRFCVVNPQRGPLAGKQGANAWDDPPTGGPGSGG